MPPGPAYNWFCTLHSISDILGHAVRYRAAQLNPRATFQATPRKRRRTEDLVDDALGVRTYEDIKVESVESVREATTVEVVPLKKAEPHHAPENASDISREATATLPVSGLSLPDVHEPQEIPRQLFPDHAFVSEKPVKSTPAMETLAEETIVLETDVRIHPADEPVHVIKNASRNLQSSKVPSSRIGRLFHYGGLAASLGYGAASEIIRRTGGGSQGSSSVMMTEANIKRLVSKLSQMRGAALKLGQFMSIQDTHVLPPEIDKIFRRVQDSAHYMPDWQMEQVMISSLGPTWSSNFTSFDRLPFAAASIGQVHTAILAPHASPTGRAEAVAVKIQFPNIVNSIESDLGYIRMLLTAGKLLPRGLFLDRTINVMKDELADECNYTREASFLKTFRDPDHLGNDPRFKVPWVWDGSTNTVLVMERVEGVSVGEADASRLSIKDRDDISAWIIELCLKELFEFRAMQTDPNWTNFLWNPDTRQVELVDFGATRTYSKEFMDNWLRLLQAAASEDRTACAEWSLKLGYLTGEENEVMLNAHINSIVLLATPFKATTPQPFTFGQGTKWADITAEIRAQIPVMLQHRLTPPPSETYSLNRKLSGAFLLASRLGATVDTKAIWDRIVKNYKFSP
ncbi:ABC1 family-domain-containing protein [Crucibulum laeve]|uniref:ABC1 family-domain-containing protein n=1 Tax=Crucibulum laeve TaxID=68775 RepID=A0A5C3LXF8_9AGAR|nr:ABC1 family-domain-containing protein [Crucibulum laeve]